jgi:hypothetical protein
MITTLRGGPGGWCQQGVIRPSDTNKIRLFQTNLLVEDVEWGSTGHSYFQVIREDAGPLDQNPGLLLFRSQPDRLDIEVPQDSSDLLETDVQVALDTVSTVLVLSPNAVKST